MDKKLPHISYSAPSMNDTAVIFPFFNPANSIRLQQNILYVYHQCKSAGIPVFVGELCFNEQTPLFQESDSVFIFRSESYMFYKENLLNLVLQKPALQRYQKYVILDADIVFENPNWVDAVSLALQTYDVIQPYEYACKLNKNFKNYDTMPCICKFFIEKIRSNLLYGHTGYAWAFRRHWYNSIGNLFEHAIIGGGDTCLAYSLGISTHEIEPLYKSEIRTSPPQTKIGYIPEIIYHLPHGPFAKRQYNSRMKNLKAGFNTFSITKITDAVEKNPYGVYEWKPELKEAMNRILLDYFIKRDDDNFD